MEKSRNQKKDSGQYWEYFQYQTIIPLQVVQGENSRDEIFQEISEIDAFGPWILEICKKYPTPPLFLPYITEEMKQAQMLIKIPRNMDRKEAMKYRDLYDYVMGICFKRLIILERVNDQVREYSVSYPEVYGIQITRELLVGKVLLYTEKGVFQIPYNTVSDDTIKRFVKLLREKSFAADFPKVSEKLFGKNIDIRRLPHLFQTELMKVEDEEEKFFPLYYRQISRWETSSMPGWLFLVSHREVLILLARELGDANGIHSTSRLHLPISRLEKSFVRKFVADEKLAAACGEVYQRVLEANK